MKKFCIACLTIVLSIWISGCATTPEIDKPLEPLKFEKEQIYTLDTSKLAETDPPNFILLIEDKNGTLRHCRADEEPTHVALSQDDLVKLDAMVTTKNAYKDISKEQGHLINIERDKVNALKEMLALERQNRQLERDLRQDVEKAYKQERKDHRLDNIVNRATLVVTVVGGVAIAAIGM